MKKIFYLVFLWQILTGYASYAQSDNSNGNFVSNEGRLTADLPTTGDGMYYHVFPFKFEKGMGYVFFMRSRQFTPNIALFDEKKQQLVGEPVEKFENGERIVTIEFTPEKDSSLLVFLTSQNKADTGYFTYGYGTLTAEQLNFNKSWNTCEKLLYLFNHWQTYWRLAGKRIDINTKDKNTITVYDSKYFSNTLTASGKASISPDGYEEIVYSKDEMLTRGLDTLPGIKVYERLVKEITACLGSKDWQTESEKTGVDNKTTWFFPVGIKRKDWGNIFRVEYLHGNVLSPTEVKFSLY